MPDCYAMLRPLLFALPPEKAHHFSLASLAFMPACPAVKHPSLEGNLFGLHFKNPVGMAAGYDKNAEAIDGLFKLGFGFVEAGTVTPLPQPGNPQPRLFRLVEDKAVINRLGFNNEGLEAFVRHFRARKKTGIAGGNIGKNKDSEDAVADYVTGLKAVYPYADYITVNISSPNTQGLRDLQKHDALKALLSALRETRDALAQNAAAKPLLLKVAPDLTMSEKEDIASLVLSEKISGLIVSNTTISRPVLKSAHAAETGGLSGSPLFALSNEALKDFYKLTGGKLPLVGVGGIASAEDAYAKIKAGASLVQLYTALIYQGPGLVKKINKGLVRLLQQDGFATVAAAVGADSR